VTDSHQEAFLSSPRRQIMMITNHGVHEWQITPGLPDTGGQNVFVNQMSAALARQGFRVTIVNRGGYPHPETGQARKGFRYKGDHQRILYITDGHPDFVPKEEMKPHIPHLAETLYHTLSSEGSEADLIISHYWDGAQVGIHFNNFSDHPLKHIWVPHSLGTIKMNNVSPKKWEELHIIERIISEHRILGEIDGVGSTSTRISEALREDYDYQDSVHFLPPCVDPQRFTPKNISADHKIWDFLLEHSSLSRGQLQSARMITEVSRTDTTKRKGLLISAFARVLEDHPDALLLITITDSNSDLYQTLMALINDLKIGERVIVLGSIWEELPTIYNLTDIYCTPSVMEGFGMSAQEAAASQVSVVASSLVPFAVEYLLGDNIRTVACHEDQQPIEIGAGAVIVPADSQEELVCALKLLLDDNDLRAAMAKNAYQITVPRFTWDRVIKEFLHRTGEDHD